MRIVCISDTHSQHDRLQVPDGDLLIHAGDFTKRGSVADITDFNRWLTGLPHRYKVVIAGNHDFLFENDPALARSLLTHATYLQDSGVVIERLRVWGSPWQPRYFDWAFNLDRGADLRRKWDQIPGDTDLLITHGPPMGILDRTWTRLHVGCEELKSAVERVSVRAHVFGHIHEAYGVSRSHRTLYVNACTCDRDYRPVQDPIVLDWIESEVRVVRT